MYVDKNALLEFIWKAHQNTYAAPKDIRLLHKTEKSVLHGFIGYAFADGDWKYHDSYAGRRWPPGREVVFFKDIPVWCMSYQGKVSDNLDEQEVNSVYSFLKIALRKADRETPFRGPSKFLEADLEYVFRLNGNYAYFTGRESVVREGTEVFFQDIMGSLIK
jgi:hypothetical protein